MPVYTANFRAGPVVRRSRTLYVAASVNAGNHVAFHKTFEAAHAHAGRDGEVVEVTAKGKGSPRCIVCDGGKVYSVRRADGSYTTLPCYRCVH